MVQGGAQRSQTRSIATGMSGRRRSRRNAEQGHGVSRACRSRPGATTRRAKAWYFHRFYDFQPDLNTSNPEVQAEILKIMGFWIQLGVSGFRMDAVPFVIATKGAKRQEAVEQYDMLRALPRIPAVARGRRDHSRRSQCAAANPTWSISATDGDRMHMMFNFQVNQNLFYALAAADAGRWSKRCKATKPRPATRAMGSVSAQSRRTRSRAADRGAAPDGVRALRARTRTCSSTIAASGADSRPCSTATGGASNSPTA